MHHFIQQGTVAVPVSPAILARPLLEDAGRPHHRLTMGHYFAAIDTFLADRFHTEPAAFSITSIKLGAFYHVARVEHRASGRRWAINTAFTDHGRRCLAQDAKFLEELYRRRPLVPEPAAHESSFVEVAGHRYRFDHLLTEWLDDFHEWHGTDRGIVLWDTIRGDRLLDTGQIHRLFFGIGRLLALALDPATGRCLTDWHHGAGDFVARPAPLGLEVKLVTVRDFAPLPVLEPESVLPLRLFYFLLDASIRVRLDKRNGVGETVWHDDAAMTAAFAGLCRGLADQEADGTLPAGTAAGLRDLVSAFTPAELTAACAPLLAWYKTILDPEDLGCLHHRLADHLALFHSLATAGAP